MVLLRSCRLPPCRWCLPSAGLQVRPVPFTCLRPSAAASRSICAVDRCLGQQLVPILCILPKCSWGEGPRCSGVCTGLRAAKVWKPLIYLMCLSAPVGAVCGIRASISCAPGVPPCALLLSRTSRANLSNVFLDSSLTQLVRIFKYFDLFFLKYQLSEAHIGLMKQVQFVN